MINIWPMHQANHPKTHIYHYSKYHYNIEVSYDPLILNCYHMESIIICTETHEEIPRSKIQGYRKAIASDIKVQLMNKKKVEIYNYEDLE